MSTLYNLTGEFQQLLTMIQDGEYLEEELADTLEGLGGEIEIKADGYAKVIKEIEGNVSTIKAEIDRLGSKKLFMDNSIKSLKQSLEMAMRATGKTKFKTQLFSFGIQKNGGKRKLVLDIEVDKLPSVLTKVTTVYNDEEIRKLLIDEKCEYAHLDVQSESLRIK